MLLREKVSERLVELSQDAFLWPETDVKKSNTALSDDETWPEEGLLSYMGYRVGQKGAIMDERRRILDYIYSQPVPRVISAEYMAEWGSPKTGPRLQKMAESLAAFTRNSKRKLSKSDLAIHEWEADLEYLRKSYYVGRYDTIFVWPPTAIA